jgi:hypothetical protein
MIQLDLLLPKEALSHLVHALKGGLEKNKRILVFFKSCVLADAFLIKSLCHHPQIYPHPSPFSLAPLSPPKMATTALTP